MTEKARKFPLTASHWGTYRAEVVDGKLRAMHGFEQDPDPSPIGQGYVGTLDDPLRIKTPMVRKGWLDGGPGATPEGRGSDPFVSISWDEAERLVADELNRVRTNFGNQAIFGGSYGWSGAGRFHHAQSQLHRFLNSIGGYTKSVNSYSLAAGEVILPHVLGDAAEMIHRPTSWQSVIDHSDLLVAFGGMPLRNSQVTSGGTARHRAREALGEAKQAGVDFVNISPIRSDMADDLGADWIAPRPGSDIAIMLGLAHELLRQDLHDKAFLARFTTGFDQFKTYLTGQSDGVEKTADWAAQIAGIDPSDITDLAQKMTQGRTIIATSWSLTRQENGEQPFWMATVLAAMLGQIGLPGGGVAFGYCAANSVGMERRALSYASLPKLSNPVNSFIPVARISDMLLNPGGAFTYNGKTAEYPDIRLIYWAGGNPFHHHQDLTKLNKAWQKPETIIVNEWCWTATARRADIVLPCTTQLERRDLMLTPRDPYIIAMEQVVDPVGDARNDFDIFSSLSTRLGAEQVFTEGRDSEAWLRWLYQESRQRSAKAGVELPEYEALLGQGWHYVDPGKTPHVALSAFRNDPENAPLATPSGLIEITSDTIASFKAGNLHPHPVWIPPEEWQGNARPDKPFHLISGQPAGKLHSQLDHGAISRAAKIDGRTPVTIHPKDAQEKNIGVGDLVRVFNDRGACLTIAVLDTGLRRGVIHISTGAWLDAVVQADGTQLCRHGNPNTLTRDIGTSGMAQGTTAHSCLVNIEKYSEEAPEIMAFVPPQIQGR